MKRKFIWLFLTVLAIFATTGLAVATTWPTAQGNFQRTGYNPSVTVDPVRLTKVWTYNHPTHAALWSDPVDLNGRVFATFASFTGAPNLVEALDINTGALLWSNVLTSTGTAARGTPTAATIDTTGLGDFGDMVYVAKGSSGGGAGIRCIDAVTGLTRWDAATGAQVIRYSRPALADTNGNGTFDIVVIGTQGGALWAFDAVTGAFAWTTTLDAGYYIVFGPSTSSDGKVIYAGTSDLTSTLHGRVHAVDATTGAILGSFDPLINGAYEDEGYTAPIIYVDDNTVVACGYGANGSDGRYTILDRNANLLGQGSVNNRAVFNAAAIYPDPLSTDTLCIVPTENGMGIFGVPIIVRARNIPTMRGGGSGFKYNLYACNGANFLSYAPIATANSPDGYGVAAINTDGGGTDCMLYTFPAKSATGTTNVAYWNKQYLASVGFLNRSGALWTDGANDSGIVFVTQEGYSMVHAFRASTSPRARWTDETGCLLPELLNVPLALNGTDTDTLTFFNIGDASGSYSVSATPFAASVNGMNVSKANIQPRATSSVRERLADDQADAMTVTSKMMFMSKGMRPHQEIALLDQFPQLPSRSSFMTKQREAATSAGIPVWLTVTDLTGGGPVAPGGSADIELVASSSTLPLGTYFADLHLTVAPDEPDPDFYGGTDLVVPITFIVGFVPEETFCEASDAALEITNWGGFGPSNAGFPWNGHSGANFFQGGLVVIESDTLQEAAYGDHGQFLSDQIIWTDVTLNPSPYVSEVDICTTAYLTQGGASSLRVQQYAVGLWDGAFCDSMIILKFVFTNVGAAPCTLKAGLYFDWDNDPYGLNLGDGDVAHQIMWIYVDGDSTLLYGLMRKPSDDVKALGFLVDNTTSIYNATNPGTGQPPHNDSLRKWFNTPNGTFDMFGNSTGPDDKSMVMGVSGIVINPGEKHLEEYIVFGWDVTNVPFDKAVWKTWLRQEGFYRGDVNTDNRGHDRSTAGVDLGAATNGGGINVTDIVYLANYYLKGTNSPWPFTDQGDVNCDGVVSLVDVIYLANFVFKKGPAPIDKNRFLPPDYQALFSRTSISLLPAYK